MGTGKVWGCVWGGESGRESVVMSVLKRVCVVLVERVCCVSGRESVLCV